jgi:hypothetical protein
MESELWLAGAQSSAGPLLRPLQRLAVDGMHEWQRLTSPKIKGRNYFPSDKT